MNTDSSLYQELTNTELRLLVSENLHAELRGAMLLDGGMFNTTYRICYGDELKKAVLRCGPVNRHLLLPFEINLMQAENYVDRLCEQQHIPSSRVLVCDTGRQLIDRDYMIVEYIDSVPLSDPSVPPEQKPELYRQVGEIINRFHANTGDRFGRVSQILEGRGFASWCGYLMDELNLHLAKLRLYHAFTEDEEERIRGMFETRQALFLGVTTPHLLHTDLWEGNILVHAENGIYSIAAVIDADRALYGDLDYEYASGWMITDDFLRGYRGGTGVNFNGSDYNCPIRQFRRKLYRIPYYLIECYVGLAEYNRPEQYLEFKKRILDLVEETETAGES